MQTDVQTVQTENFVTQLLLAISLLKTKYIGTFNDVLILSLSNVLLVPLYLH